MVVAAPLAFLAIGLGLGDASTLNWVATWVTPFIYALGALICFGATRTECPSWKWFGLACLLWAAANAWYALFIAPDPIPLPAIPDIGYFLFPIAFGYGVITAARTRLSKVPRDVMVDALIVALTCAAVASLVLFRVIDIHTDSFGAAYVSLIYPFEDVVVIGLMAGIGTLLNWRLDRVMRLLFCAIALIAAADLIVSTRVLSGNPVGGAWANLGWTGGIAVLALAARSAGQAEFIVARRAATFHVGLPETCAFINLGVVAVTQFPEIGAIFALTALVLVCFRLTTTLAAARELADQRRLALTDELTDLPNRRRLLHDLERACAGPEPRLLALFDLDGFKHYNDTHGHTEGDGLLVVLSTRLANAVRGHGTAYRLGGDEFCVLVSATPGGRDALREADRALRAEGPGWAVGSTYGVVEVPAEATTPSDALRTADGRMYAAKERRPVAARQQVRDVLLSALGEQQPTLHTHTQDVTDLAGAVALCLGMDPGEADDVVRAAELHDVGKLAIPASILDKPGPLDETEWDLMRRHTVIGERMLRAAAALRPIAPLVRSSHERWDGEGYPDGLRGEEIPLGARIVAVCDSYDAMVADRPYRAGMPHVEAIAEIERNAGTQFDPAVVDAFLRVQRGEVDDRAMVGE